MVRLLLSVIFVLLFTSSHRSCLVNVYRDLRFDLHAPCAEIRAHKHRVCQVVWQDRAAFHTASYDGSIRSWDSIHGSSLRILPIFESEGIEQIAMARPVAFMRGLDAEPEQRTGVVALGWSGAVKFFTYDSSAHP